MQSKTQDGARTKFLERASYLLTSTSPAVSAHLRLESNNLAPETTQDSQEHPQSCLACGNLLAPGWSCNIVTNVSSKRTRDDRIEKGSGNVKTVRLQCLSCAAVTLIATPKPATKIKKAKNLGAPGATTVDTSPVSQALQQQEDNKGEDLSRPPRKRAKGKKSTLQSLLSEQKRNMASTQKNFRLELTDFMKT